MFIKDAGITVDQKMKGKKTYTLKCVLFSVKSFIESNAVLDVFIFDQTRITA